MLMLLVLKLIDLQEKKEVWKDNLRKLSINGPSDVI